jgi:hypothetical protein
MLSALENAKQIKERLRNPVNGRQSSELDVISAPQLRRQSIKAETQRREVITGLRWDAMMARLKVERERAAIDTARREREERERGILTMATIIKVVCAWYGVTHIDIISARKTRDIVGPRMMAMYLARHHTTLSFPQIGRKIGGRDHTTALHAVNKIRSLVEAENQSVISDIARLRAVLGIAEQTA